MLQAKLGRRARPSSPQARATTIFAPLETAGELLRCTAGRHPHGIFRERLKSLRRRSREWLRYEIEAYPASPDYEVIASQVTGSSEREGPRHGN